MKKVVCISRILPHYRVAFFEKVKRDLESQGVEFIFVYGTPCEEEKDKSDLVDSTAGLRVKNFYFGSRKGLVCWQPALHHLNGADLVIVSQANKLIINYFLVLMKSFGFFKVAFWGHGRNFQSNSSKGFLERVKGLYSRLPSWWFAYNKKSMSVVRDLGFPMDKITNVQNAIDTSEIEVLKNSIGSGEVEEAKKILGISDNTCIYIGGLYKKKRLSFLVESAILIRREVGDFNLLVVGGGEEYEYIKEKEKEHPWIKVVGPKFGREKVLYAQAAKLMLMPGLVGLAVIDSFSLGVPMITTGITWHSPEVDYLESGFNGEIVSPCNDASIYAARVVDLLRNEEERKVLVDGCEESKGIYSIDNMARNFAVGVLKALENG